MKRNLLIPLLLLFICFAKAQTNTFPASGNVGIGTMSPLKILDIRGSNILVKNLNNETGESMVMIDHSLSFGPYQNFGTSLRTYTEDAGNNRYALQFFTQDSYLTGQTEKLRISAIGNVGIGVKTPAEKLSVNGNIRAREIKVEATNWPDYVFKKDYKIKDLAEIDAYIKAHNHLPDMPSAKEVGENGVALGEMNKLLLKKIEELTLYLIQQQKEIDVLKAKVN